LIAELRRRLAAEVASREKMQRRLETVTAERDTERQQRRASEECERELRQELESVEFALSAQLPIFAGDDEQGIDLRGTILLYVGVECTKFPNCVRFPNARELPSCTMMVASRTAADCSRPRCPGRMWSSFRLIA
jgi:hypothetical protein